MLKLYSLTRQEVPVQGARRASVGGHGPHRGLHTPLPGILCGDPASHVGALLTQLVILANNIFEGYLVFYYFNYCTCSINDYSIVDVCTCFITKG